MKSRLHEEKSGYDNNRAMTFNYFGASMIPTLKAGDRMTVLPYRERKARPGDLVVFRSPANGHTLVHRIVCIDDEGRASIQGDNNRAPDPWILNPHDIIGQVLSVRRDHRNIILRTGIIGIAIAKTLHTRKIIIDAISIPLRPLYQKLSTAGIFHGCLSPFFSTKLLYFKKKHGTEIQVTMGKWLIGRYIPQKGSWQIRRPFRLFIDTSALPKGGAIDENKS